MCTWYNISKMFTRHVVCMYVVYACMLRRRLYAQCASLYVQKCAFVIKICACVRKPRARMRKMRVRVQNALVHTREMPVNAVHRALVCEK